MSDCEFKALPILRSPHYGTSNNHDNFIPTDLHKHANQIDSYSQPSLDSQTTAYSPSFITYLPETPTIQMWYIGKLAIINNLIKKNSNMNEDRNPPNSQKEQAIHTGHYLKYQKDKTLGKRDYKTNTNLKIRQIDPATNSKQFWKELAVILDRNVKDISAKEHRKHYQYFSKYRNKQVPKNGKDDSNRTDTEEEEVDEVEAQEEPIALEGANEEGVVNL